jgi:hypothetical protein
MTIFADYQNRRIRFTNERRKHLEESHPEMREQINKIEDTLALPDFVIRSKTDTEVELHYKFYKSTPVNENIFVWL